MKHLGFLAALVVTLAAPPQGISAPPEHAILWVVDGISFKAPERMHLKNLEALMSLGVYYRQTYTVETADPSHQPGQWSQYYTCSIPNPVLLAGTEMLLPGRQHYVQESFFPQRITAHSTNEIAYRALNVGFSLTFQGGGQAARAGGLPEDDGLAVYWATQFMRKMQPAFTLVHLQDTGGAGSRSRGAPAHAPWKDNIWGDGSPYRQTLAQADVYLGQFIDELKKEGLWDKTILFVTGDHGQTDTGWHAEDAEDAWAMPLVMAGPGIKRGQPFDYAEAIDIVPTLCYLMGVKPPRPTRPAEFWPRGWRTRLPMSRRGSRSCRSSTTLCATLAWPWKRPRPPAKTPPRWIASITASSAFSNGAGSAPSTS